MSPWLQVTEGLWLGSDGRPLREEFEYVLTLTREPPPSDEGLRHRCLAIPARPEQIHPALDQAVAWVGPRWREGGRTLVQSPGWLWAELAIACLWVHLGAGPDDAISSLRRVRAEALADPQLRDLVIAREVGRA